MVTEDLYKDFVDQHQNNLTEAMRDEIRHLFIEVSAISDVDKINIAAGEYADIVMKLIWETRYEW